MGGQALVLAILMGAFCYSGRKNTHKSGRGASALSLTLPTCFREFHRACPARDVPG